MTELKNGKMIFNKDFSSSMRLLRLKNSLKELKKIIWQNKFAVK